MDPKHLLIELLDAEASNEIVLELTKLINHVYGIAEGKMWEGEYSRTDIDKVRQAIIDEEIIIAKLGADLVATVAVKFIGGKVAKFGMLSVHPDYEGLGIGGKLIRAAEEYVKEKGCKKMRLEILVPKNGQHLGKVQLDKWYRKLNYQFVKELPFESVAPTAAKTLTVPCFFHIYDKKL